jgi:hypothetical protein
LFFLFFCFLPFFEKKQLEKKKFENLSQLYSTLLASITSISNSILNVVNNSFMRRIERESQKMTEQLNELLTQFDEATTTMATVDDENRKRRILYELLSLEKPMMTSAISRFLKSDGVLALFFDFIVRPPCHEAALADYRRASESSSSSSTNASDDASMDCQDENDDDDENVKWNYCRRRNRDLFATKLSWRAMKLCAKKPLNTLVKKEPLEKAAHLWHIFDACSEGNFNHWRQVIERVLAGDWSRVSLFMLHRRRVCDLINHLHEPAVQSLLLDNLLKGADIAWMKPDERVAFFSTLSLAEFLPQLCERIYSDEFPLRSSVAAGLFFRRLVGELAACEDADRFFIKLGESDSMLGGLADCAASTKGARTERVYYVSRARESAASLETLLQTSRRQLYASTIDAVKPVQQNNALERVRAVLYKPLHSRVPKLCDALLRLDADDTPAPAALRLSAFCIDEPLTSHRLAIVNILAELVQFNCAATAAQIRAPVWRLLCAWFFSQRVHNNFLHHAFYTLVAAVVRDSHEPSLRALLGQCGLASALVDDLAGDDRDDNDDDKDDDLATDTAGHSLLIANTLRLVAGSLPPTAFLRAHLSASQPWQHFLPTLIERTESTVLAPFVAGPPGTPQMGQATPNVFLPTLPSDVDGDHQKSADDGGASSSSSAALSSAAMLSPSISPVSSIELGSAYAHAIGLGHLRRYDPKRWVPRRRKTAAGALLSTFAGLSVSTSPTGALPSSSSASQLRARTRNQSGDALLLDSPASSRVGRLAAPSRGNARRSYSPQPRSPRQFT